DDTTDERPPTEIGWSCSGLGATHERHDKQGSRIASRREAHLPDAGSMPGATGKTNDNGRRLLTTTRTPGRVDRLPKTASLMKVVLKSSTPDSVREVTVFVADEDKPEKYVQVNRETPKEPKKALSPSQLENVEFPSCRSCHKFVRVVLKTLPGKATSVRAELKACHKPKTTTTTTTGRTTPSTTSRKPGSPAAEKLTFPMPSMPGATGKTTTTPAPTTTTRRPAVCLRKSVKLFESGELPSDALTKAEKLPEKKEFTPKERKEALLPSGSGLPVKRGGSTQLTFQVDRLPKTASLMKVVLKSSTPDSVREVTVFVADEDKPEKYVQVNRETPKEPKKALSPSQLENVEFPELPKLPKFVRVVLKTLPGKATSVRAELKACHKPKTTDDTTDDDHDGTHNTEHDKQEAGIASRREAHLPDAVDARSDRKDNDNAGAYYNNKTPGRVPAQEQRRAAQRRALTKAEKLPEKKEFTPKERKEALLPSGSGLPVKRGGSTQLTFQVDRLPKTASLMKVVLKSSTPDSVREVTVFVADEDKPEKYVQVNRETPKEPKKALSPSQLENVEFPELPKLPKFVRVVLKTLPGKATSVRAELKACHKPKTTVRTTQQTTTTTGRTTPSTTSRKPGSPAAEKLTFPMPSMPGATGKTTTTPAPTTTTRRPAVCLRKSVKLFESGELPSDALTKAEKLPEKKEFTPKERKEALLPSGSGLPVKRGGSTQLTFQVDRLPKTASLMKVVLKSSTPDSVREVTVFVADEDKPEKYVQVNRETPKEPKKALSPSQLENVEFPELPKLPKFVRVVLKTLPGKATSVRAELKACHKPKTTVRTTQQTTTTTGRTTPSTTSRKPGSPAAEKLTFPMPSMPGATGKTTTTPAPTTTTRRPAVCLRKSVKLFESGELPSDALTKAEKLPEKKEFTPKERKEALLPSGSGLPVKRGGSTQLTFQVDRLPKTASLMKVVLKSSTPDSVREVTVFVADEDKPEKYVQVNRETPKEPKKALSPSQLENVEFPELPKLPKFVRVVLKTLPGKATSVRAELKACHKPKTTVRTTQQTTTTTGRTHTEHDKQEAGIASRREAHLPDAVDARSDRKDNDNAGAYYNNKTPGRSVKLFESGELPSDALTKAEKLPEKKEFTPKERKEALLPSGSGLPVKRGGSTQLTFQVDRLPKTASLMKVVLKSSTPDSVREVTVFVADEDKPEKYVQVNRETPKEPKKALSPSQLENVEFPELPKLPKFVRVVLKTLPGKATSVRAELKACHKPKTTVRTTQQTTTTTGRTTPSTTSRKPGSPAAEKLTFPMPSMPGATGKTTTTPAPTTTTRRPAVCLRKSVKLFESGELPSDALTKAEKLPEKKEFTPKERKEALLPSGSGLPVKRGGSTQLTFQVDRLPKTASLMKVVLKSSTPDSVREVTVFVADEDKPEKYVQVNRETPKEPKKALSPSQLENVEFPELPKLPKFVRVVLKTLPGKATSVRAELKACHKPKTTVRTTQQTTTTTGRTTPSTTSRKPGSPAAEKLTFPMPSMPGATGKTTTTPAPTTTTRRPAVCLRKSVKLFESGELPSDALTKAEKLPEKKEFTPKERKEALLPSGSGLPVKRGGSTQLTFQVDRLPKTASLMKVVLKSSTPDSVREVTVFVADEDKPEKYVQVNRETPKEPKKALSPSQLENVEFPELPKLPKFVRVVLKTLPGKATSVRAELKACHKPKTTVRTTQQTTTTTGRTTPSTTSRKPGSPAAEKLTFPMPSMPGATGKTTTTPAPTTTTRRPAVCLRKSVKLFESGELPSDALTKAEKLPEKKEFTPKERKEALLPSGSGLPVKRGGGPVREVTVFVADEDKPEKYVQVNRETPKEPKKALSPSQLENVEFPELPKLPKFVRVVLKTLPGKATSVRAELKACHKPKTTVRTTQQTTTTTGRTTPSTTSRKPGSPAAEKLTFPMPSMPGATGKTTTTPAPTTTTRRPAVCLRKSVKLFESGELPSDALTKAEKLPEKKEFTPKERKEALLPSGSGLPVKRGGSTQLTFQVDRLPKTASLMKVVLKSSTPDSVREVTVFVADEDKPEKYVQVNRETPKEPKKALSPSQLENVEFPELPKLPKFVRVVLKTLPGKATSVRAELKACHKPKTTDDTTDDDHDGTHNTRSRDRTAEKLTFPMPSMPGATGKTTTTPAPTTTTSPAVCLRSVKRLRAELPSDALKAEKLPEKKESRCRRCQERKTGKKSNDNAGAYYNNKTLSRPCAQVRKSVKLFESGELPSDAMLTKAEKLPEKKEFTPKERKEALLPSGSGLPVKRGGSTQLTFQVDRLPKTASLMKVVLKSSTPDSVREVTVFVADEDKPEKYVQVNRETPKEPKKALSPSQLENVEFPELPKLPKFVRVVLKTLPGKATSVRAELKACHKPKTTVRTTQQTTTTTGRTTPSTTSRKPGSPAAEKLTFPMPSMPGATGKTTTTPAPTTTTRRPAVCLRKSVKLFESGELPSDALTKAEKLPEKKEFTPKERKEALLPSGSGLPVKRGGSTQLTFQVDLFEVTVFVADEDKPEKYVQVNRETPKEPKKALSPSQLENVEFPELPKLPKFVRVVLKTLPGKATSVRAELKACHKPKTTVRTTQQTTTTTGRTTPSTTSRKPGSPAAEKLTFPMPSMPGATGKTTTTPAPTTTTRRPAVCLRKSVKLFESGELPSDALTKAEKLPEKKEFTPKERKEALLPSGSGLPVKRGGSTQLTFQVDRLPKTASLMKVVLKSSTPDSVREVTVFVADEDKPEKYVQVNRETPKEPKKALSPSQLENVEFPELPKLPKFVRVVLKTLPGKATSVRAELKACHKPKTTVRTTQQTTTTTGRTTPSTTSRKPGSPAAEKLTFPMPSMPGATGKTTTTPAPTTTTRRPAVCLRKSVKLFESGELPSDALTKAEKLPEKKEFTPKERKEALLPSGSGLPVKRGGSTQLTFQVDRLPKTASLMKVVLKSSTPDSVREVTVFVADEDKPEKYVQVNRETPKEPKKALSPSQLENVEFPELPKLPKFVRVVLKTLPGKATSVRAELKACHKPKTTVRTTQQTTTTTGRTTPSTTSRKPGSPAAEKLTFPMPSMPGATGKTTTTPAPTTTTRRPAVCLRKSVKLFESGELPSDALTKAEKLPEKKEFTPKERKEALLPSGSGLPVKRGGSTQLTFQVDRLPKTASLMKVVLKSSTPDSVREVTVFVADEDKPEKYVQVNRETPKEPKKALSPSQLENVEFPELPKLPKFVRVVLKTLPGKATSVRAELKACHKPKTTVRTTQQTTTTTGRTTPSTTSRKPGSPAAEKLTFPMPSMPGATGKTTTTPAPTTTTRRPAVCLRKSVKLFESGELPSDALTKAEKLPEKKEFTPKERKEALLPSGSGLPVKRGGSTQLTFQVDRLPKTASLMKVVLKSSTPDSVREVTVFVADEDKPEKYVQVNRETPKEPKKALSPSQLENVEFPELPKLPKFVRVVLKTLPGKATSVRAELKACHKPKTTVRTTQQTTTTTGRTTPSTTSRKPGSPAAEKLTFPMPSMPGATGKTTTTPAPTTTTRRPAVCLRKSVKLFESGELPSDALTKAEKLPEKKEFTPKERKEALLPSGSGLPVKRGGSTQLTFQVDRLPKTASLMKVVLKSSTPDSVREVTVFVADEDKPEKYVQVNRETPKEPKKALSPSQLENVEFPELPKLPKFVRVVLKTLPGKATSVRAELKACHKPKTTVRTTQQTTTTTGRTTPSTTSRKPGSPAAEKLTFPMPSMPGATGKTTTTPAPTTTTRRPAVCLRKSVKLFESGELPSDALTKAEKLPEKKEFTPKERKEALLPSGSGLPVKRGGSTQLTFQVDRLPKTASLMKVVLKSSTPDSVREVTVFVADEDKPEKYVQVNRETPKEPKKALSPSQLENVEFPELPKLPKFVRVVLKTLPGKATSVRAELKACHKPKTTVRTTQQTTTTTGRTTPSTTSRKPGSPAAEKLTFPMPSMPGATGKTTTTPAPTTTTRRPAVCLRKSVKLFESGELPSDALTKAEKLPEKKEFTPKERKEALLPSGSGLPVKRGGSTQLTFQVDRLPKTASLMKVVLKSSTPDSVREVTVFVADEDKPEKYVQVNRETPKEPKKALSPSQLENVEFPELPKLPKFVRVVLKTLPGKATSVRAELKACHKPKTTVRTTQQTTTTTGRTTPSTTSRKPGSPAAEKLTFPMPSMPGATGKTTTTPAPTTTTRRPAVCLRKSVKLFESGELPSDALTKAEKLPEKKEFTPKERKEALLPSGSGLPVKRGGSTQLTFQVDRLPKTASLMKVVLKSSTPDSVREVTVFVADEDKPEKYVQVNRETPKEPKKALSPSQLENVEFPELPKLPKFVRVVLKTLPGKATSVRAELKACHKPKTTVRTTQQTTTTTGRTTPSTTSRKPGSPAAEKLTFPMPSMPGATGKTTTTPAPTTTTRRPAVCLRKSVKLFESGELPSDALTKAEKLPEKKEFTPKERKEALLPSGSGLPVKRGGSTQLTFQVDRLPKTASLMKVVLKSSTPDSVREVTVFVADEDKPEKYVQVNRETPKEPKKALSPSQLENVEFPELPKLPKFVRVVLKTLPGKATSVRAELKACHKPKTTVRTTQQTTTTTGRTTPSTTSRKPGSPAAEKLTFPMPSMPGATGKTTTTPAPTTTTRRPAVCLRKSVKLFESGELPSDALTKAEKLPEKKEFTPKERKEALLPSGSGLPVKRGGSTQLTFQVDRLPKTASLMKVVLKSSTPDSVREVTVFVADEDKPEKYVQVNRETPKEPKKALSPSQLENVEFPELPKLPKFVRVVLKTLPGKATSVRAELKACHKPKTTVRTTQQTTTTTGRTTPSTTSRKPGSPAAEKLTFPMPSMPGATGKTTTTPAPTTTTRRPAVCLRKSVKLFESGELPSDALTKAEKLPEKKEFTPKERKEALLPSGSGLPVKRGGSTQLTFQVDRLPKTASLMKVVLKSSTPDSVREVTVFVADEDKPEKYVQVNRETPKEPKKALSPSQLENVEFPELPKLPKFVRVVLKTLPGKATSVRAELKACHKPKTTVRTTQQTTTTTGRTTPSTTSRKPGSPAAEKLTFPMPSMPGATGKTTTTPAPTTTTRRPAVCLRKSVKLFESGELPSDALTKAEKLPEKKEFTPKERKEALLPSGSGLPVKRGGSTQLTFQVDRLPKTASLMKVVLKSSTPDSVREVTVFVADEDKPEKYVQVNRETPKEPKKALSPSQLENVEFPELPKLPKFVRVVLKTLPGKATSVRAELKACHKPKTTVRTTQQTTTTTGRTTPSTTSRKPGSPAAEKLTFPMPSMPGATGKTTTTPAPTTTTRRPAVCLRKSVKLFESGELPSDALTKAEKLPEKKEFTPKERKEALLPSGSGLPVKRGGSTQLTFQVDRLPKTASLMKVVLKSSTPDSVREVTVFVADEDKPEKYVQVNRETPKEPKKALSPSQLENVEFPELPKLPKFVRVVLKTLPGKATSVRAELKACHKPKTTVRTTQQTTTTTGRTTPSTTSRKPGSPAAEKLTFPMPSMPGATGKTTTTPAPTTTTRRPAVCLRKSVKLFESGELPSDALTKAEKLPEKKEFTPLLPSGRSERRFQLTFQVDPAKDCLEGGAAARRTVFASGVCGRRGQAREVQVNRETPKEPEASPSQLGWNSTQLKFVRVLKTLPGKATGEPLKAAKDC
uniref:Microtubule-associated protein futsch n=1 Tax=Macrostomum lignano TaxID=282301 RepID=A0A1I8HE57_9PLAT